MTVSKVREAAAMLGLDPEAALSVDDVNTAYRVVAKEHHPDRGGDPAKFHALADAKVTMLRHVRRRSAQAAHPAGGVKCPRCKGTGTIESLRAWRSMRVRCPQCKGTGALSPSTL